MHPFMSVPNHPFMPNITDAPEEMRERALKRTADMLRKLDEVRRTLELPVEQLPIVVETYGKMILALMAEADREELAKRTSREPITMRSETRDYEPMKIKPGKPFAVIVRPQCLAFRPEDLAIHGDRVRWMVHDIKVGNRSQFAGKRGPAPGTEFGPGGILEHMRLETCQTAMDLVLEVEYIGPEADGEVFEATMVGTATN
jgi:hypothetical protein